MDGASLVLAGDNSLLDQALSAAARGFIAFAAKTQEVFDGIADRGGVFNIMKENATSAIEVMKEKFADLSAAAKEMADKVKTAVLSVLGPAGPFVGAAGSALEWIQGAFSKMGAVIIAPFTLAYAGISRVFSKMGAVIIAPFTLAYAGISRVFSGIKGVLTTIIGSVPAILGSIKNKIKSVLSETLSAVMALAPLLGASVGEGLTAGFAALREDEDAFARMSGLIKSTGGAAGFTAEQLSKMADSAADVSGSFGGDAFANAYSALLAFRNVRGDVFKDAAKSAEDMAVATGGDLAGAADKLGRSLDDPIKGVRALRSEGIKFTEAEMRMIEQMTLSGNIIGAQKAILERVAQTYKGNAATAAATFSGQLHKLNEALDDQWKAFAQALTPAISAVIPYFIRGARATQKLGESLGENVKMVVEWARSHTDVVAQWYNYVVKMFTQAGMWIIDKMGQAYTFVETTAKNLPLAFNVAVAGIKVVWEEITQNVKSVWETLGVTLHNIWLDIVTGLKAPFYDFLRMVHDQLVDLKESAGLVTKDQANMVKKVAGAGFEAAKGIRTGDKKTAKGISDEEKQRLVQLKAEYAKLAAEFGAAFGANLEKNSPAIESLKNRFKALVEGASGLTLNDVDTKMKASNQAYLIGKDAQEETGSKGAFEDLMSLQKRISSAAFKDPATMATETQTGVIKQNFQEWKKMKQEEREARKKQEEADREFNKKFDALAQAGGGILG